MSFATISDCVVTRTGDDDLRTARRFGGSQNRNQLRALADRVRSACSFSGTNGTAFLLNVYECIYGAAVVVLLTGPVLAVAGTVSFPGLWLLVALAPVGLLALGAAHRLREFRRYAGIPGPQPSFFLGSLRSLLLHEHGARDRALVELHQKYGPVVKLHMAWGCTPFVSISSAPKDLGRNDMDSNRVADRTLLSRSLMGLKRGERHTAHRQ